MFSDIHAAHTTQDLSKCLSRLSVEKMTQLTLQEAQGQLKQLKSQISYQDLECMAESCME